MGCWIDKNIDDLELKIKDYCPFSSRFTTTDNSTMEMPSPKTNSQNDNNKMNIEYDNSNNIQFFKSPNTKMNNNEENYNILNSIYLNTPMNNDQVKDNNLQNSQNIINKIDNNDETFQLLKSKNKEIYQSIKEPLFKSVLGLLPIIPKQKKGPFVEYINQIITITDYGQEIETELEIKIVNIDDDEYSSSYTINFDSSAIIEDMEFDADKGIKSIFNGHQLIFKYKLFIDDKFRVKYKYKLKRNDICKYYRSEFIGIQKMFAGAVGKYIINIPNDYCVINSENDIFKTEVLNKKYIWEDIIPENGLIDYIRISHWSAKWKCSIYQEFETEYENDYIRHVEIYTPKFYVGGNLTNQKYEIRCALNEGIDNKCIQDLGNRYKFLDILNNDKSNKPNYFKIGKYIKNYLTYDVSYTNRNLSPKDIYLQKKGVCSHFTILYNSLLNSIDIPTIYVSGIAISEEGNLDKINQIKDQNHAWTLAKINNKWIPLDCTWGLLNGILPVSHIFKYYLKSDIEYILGREKKLSLKEEFKNLDK